MPSESQLDSVFFALSDPTRRAILRRLAHQPLTVGALAKPFAVSAPAISKHMRVLENAGLICRQIVGREHHCRLNPKAMQTAENWITAHREFWESRLDRMEALLNRDHS